MIAVGILSIGLCVVLYPTLFSNFDDSTESGFDAPPALGLGETGLDRESSYRWQPSAIQRNPFVGPFASGAVVNDEFAEQDDREAVAEEGTVRELQNIPISPSELAPELTFEGFPVIGDSSAAETE